MRELLAYSQWAVVEEKLTLRIKADNNGDIYLPTAWYNTDGTQSCEYDWIVSIDGWEGVDYWGGGSVWGKVRVGYWLTPWSIHTIIIRPKYDEYGWLRAFWYKGTNIENSLVNIISDKSYKGYAISEVFCGDYFKAYQYYGCVNLINTDEELLPDTLEVIGDYYRYYEYAGCVKLVNNAEERILKTVKVIWDNYRAYQYQNCTGITKMNLRAINWASVWNNYRKNQSDNMGSDREPMNVYIEWGIEEGGDWWLINSRVKWIYVYEGLVSDYQTKFSTITSSKIKKNPDWDSFEYEFIEYIGIADSTGKIRIPIGWFSTSWSQDCAYDWIVSIDWGEWEEIDGTGSAGYVSVGSGLTEGSGHRIVIKPKTIWWGWWRAFWFYNTWAESYIKEIIHDSYKCYASNRTDTWNYYKYSTYRGCANLINSYEKLPTSVVNVGNHYMKQCYTMCISLVSAFWEVMHKNCNLWVDYRYEEYANCSSMEEHKWIAWYSGEYPTNYKYGYLSGAGNSLEVYMTRYEWLTSWLTNSLWLVDANVDKVYCYINNVYDYVNNSLWSSISNVKFKPRYYWYKVYQYYDIDKYTVLKDTGTFLNGWPQSNPNYDWWIWKITSMWMNWKVAYGSWRWEASSYESFWVWWYKLSKKYMPSTISSDKLDYQYVTHLSNWEWWVFTTYARWDRVYLLLWTNRYALSIREYQVTDSWLVAKNTLELRVLEDEQPQWWLCFSNNGQFISYTVKYSNYWNVYYYRCLYKMTKPFDLTTATYVTRWNDTLWDKTLTFSDDWYTMYSENKQYSLTIPFDITTAVDTGKTNSNWIYFFQKGRYAYKSVNNSLNLYEVAD